MLATVNEFTAMIDNECGNVYWLPKVVFNKML